MNYTHCNKIFDFFNKRLFPHLSHNFTALSFDEYLKNFSYIPKGKWLRDMEYVKVARIVVGLDPEKLAKHFKHNCVTYNTPSKPEEGYQRVIYQVSPTLHFEAAIWLWVEHEEVQSYAFLIVCYNDVDEYKKFVDVIWKFKLEGDSQDKPVPSGFNPGRTGFGA